MQSTNRPEDYWSPPKPPESEIRPYVGIRERQAMLEAGKFGDRIHIHKVEVPVCEDCGAPSLTELLEITSFGQERTFLETAIFKCPNGPHIVEHRP